MDHQTGSVAADLLVGVLVQQSHSRAAAARAGLLHQVANYVGEKGLVAHSSDWGFGSPKPHCLTQMFEWVAVVAAAHVSPAREAPPEEEVVPVDL